MYCKLLDDFFQTIIAVSRYDLMSHVLCVVSCCVVPSDSSPI